jgi:metallo-beta-lactamase family protein
MSISIAFHGAAGTVTGSCYLVRHPGGAFLVDCGLFQGPKTVKQLNYDAFPFDPRELGFVLLTHAHIDHSGLLPKLVKAGFAGRILTTEGSRDLLTFMLPDAGNIQELEVERLNRRNAQRGREEVQPIYTRDDAETCLTRIVTATYDGWVECGPGVRARFWNAGHILGSASIEVEIATANPTQRRLRLLFSGDIGPEHKLFHPDPDAPANLDHLIVESTYGDRERSPFTPAARRRALREEVAQAMKRGGNLLIPAFAVERSQELVVDLLHLFAEGALPRLPVYLDSPLATRATGVFARHARDLEDLSSTAFTAPNLRYVETAEQSAALGRLNGGAVIISASGMCDAGRIRDHLRNNLWRPNATVLLVGYQVPGTLGNLLQSGVKVVRIRGEEVAVRASIRQLDAYSGHADRRGLVDWVRQRLPIQRGIFLTHGEEAALDGLKQALIGIGCAADGITVPKLDDVYTLDAAPAAPAPTAHRLLPEALGRLDWHNDYSAFILDLQERLRAMPDEEARRTLFAKLRATLTAPSARG